MGKIAAAALAAVLAMGAALAADARNEGQPLLVVGDRTFDFTGARSVYVVDREGAFTSYVIGAPEFVNRPFIDRWEAGPPVVTRVIDGDTIEVRLAGGEIERVRLLLVDTPEVHGGAECYGREASAFVSGLLSGGDPVRLERDGANRDNLGRLLRYVWLPGDSMLNERLAAGGYAEFADYGEAGLRYATRIEDAAERARNAGAGLWGVCPPAPETPETPEPTPEPTPETPEPATAAFDSCTKAKAAGLPGGWTREEAARHLTPEALERADSDNDDIYCE